MIETQGFLVLESGEVFSGLWHDGENRAAERAGEIVFNTGHSGYEEMATDPSYFSQIIVCTAPQQGNYGESDDFWESEQIWIQGFVCLDLQDTSRESSWKNKLLKHGIPILTDVDTRQIVIQLRDSGTTWGALVKAADATEAKSKASRLIAQKKREDMDWVAQVSCKEPYDIQGDAAGGPRVAVLDFGCKKNTLRELKSRCSTIRVFPAGTSSSDIRAYDPQGILLSNGPGDPAFVAQAVETVRDLIGWRFIFGICMGHQILSLALGAKTYKLKFGHRGANHPIEDRLLKTIYMTSQNHGYGVEEKSLPPGVQVSHVNLNDATVSGILYEDRKILSVQFHPESHPGPHEAVGLFDYFIKQIV